MSLVDLAVIVAGWAFLLWSPLLRTTRTSMFLGGATLAFVGAGLIQPPGDSIIRVVLVWVYLLVFLRFQFWLAGLSSRDQEVDARLRQAMREVTAAHDQWSKSHKRHDIHAEREERRSTARACASALTELGRLRPPSEKWSEVVRLLNEYIAALREVAEGEPGAARVAPSPDALVALNERVNRAWDAALHGRDTPTTRAGPR